MLCCCVRKAREQVHKLLLLGTGESGKTTIAKQAKILYANGFTEEELRNFIPAIHFNILSGFKDILRKALKKIALPESVKGDVDFMTLLNPHEVLTPNIVCKYFLTTVQEVEKIKTLAQTPEVSKIKRRLLELQLIANFDYMYDKIDEIASPEYIPSVEDVLRIWVHSTNINEYQFENTDLLLIDMGGGQRSERRKWMPNFNDVAVLIFVVALNEYDMTLREAPDVNRMHEALNVFKTVINLESLKHTPVILLLNKIDLFKSKIERVDLKICFPDYQGGCNYESALHFVAEKCHST